MEVDDVRSMTDESGYGVPQHIRVDMGSPGDGGGYGVPQEMKVNLVDKDGYGVPGRYGGR